MRKLRPRGLGTSHKLSQLTDSRAGVPIQAMELQALRCHLCVASLQLNIGKFLWEKKKITDSLDIRNLQQIMFIFKADLSQVPSRQIRNQSYI